MIEFIKRNNIVIQFLVLILSLSGLAAYNYVSQKRVFLQQLEADTGSLVESFRASINKFESIKDTLDVQQLVRDISLGLDIFEFRYLEPDGTVVNSMFAEEVGRNFDRADFPLQEDRLGEFYREERDFTQVLAIYWPVYVDDDLVGIVDLAVDITAYQYMPSGRRDAVLRRMRVDLRNLLKAIAGSVAASERIYATVDYYDFLHNFVASSPNLVEVAIVATDGRVEVSSDPQRRGVSLGPVARDFAGNLTYEGGRPLYRIVAPLSLADGGERELLLLMDVEDYARNERKLFFTALATALLTIVLAIAINFSIYRVNLERTRRENIRLEQMVRERTAEIEAMSKTDPLTGLFNRRALEEQMAMEFKRASRYHHALSLLVVDLDLFKKINDTFGHLAGDLVLETVAGLLSELLRETDFVGRYGGEEFVVILPETTKEDAAVLGEKIRARVEAESIIHEGNVVPVTASIGVADYEPGMDACAAIFHRADVALYHSKENGRNQVTVWHPALEEEGEPGSA